MPSSAITRSPRGCLTCKNRKKKCDETRPVCTRCINGDFECLGYAYLDMPRGPRRRRKKTTAGSDQDSCPSNTAASSTPGTTSPDITSPGSHDMVNHHRSSTIAPTVIIRTPQVNSLDPDHIIQMFFYYSQQTPNGVQPFRPFPFSINHAISHRVKSSGIRLKSMYVGTRIRKAVLDGAGLSIGLRLIDDFQRQITNTILAPDTNPTDAAAYLECLVGLALASMQIFNTPTAYLLLQKSTPFFLSLATKSPELWTSDMSISVRYSLAYPDSEIVYFVFRDTIMALVLGVVPLIHYDTTLRPIIRPSKQSHIEWAHGCSAIVISMLAKVNAWRAARLVDPSHPTPTPEELQEYHAYLQEWNPTLEYGGEPADVMGRLAVQESWKHAVLVYMYMGMCGADSADPRVEASVRQVAQLCATIEAGHPLEAHITIPCIVAAAGARKEKHRAILRKKIVTSRDEKVCLVRGADFVLVLDHLWHGAAAGGHPTTWQDYVDSRFKVLPVDL